MEAVLIGHLANAAAPTPARRFEPPESGRFDDELARAARARAAERDDAARRAEREPKTDKSAPQRDEPGTRPDAAAQDASAGERQSSDNSDAAAAGADQPPAKMPAQGTRPGQPSATQLANAANGAAPTVQETPAAPAGQAAATLPGPAMPQADGSADGTPASSGPQQLIAQPLAPAKAAPAAAAQIPTPPTGAMTKPGLPAPASAASTTDGQPGADQADPHRAVPRAAVGMAAAQPVEGDNVQPPAGTTRTAAGPQGTPTFAALIAAAEADKAVMKASAAPANGTAQPAAAQAATTPAVTAPAMAAPLTGGELPLLGGGDSGVLTNIGGSHADTTLAPAKLAGGAVPARMAAPGQPPTVQVAIHIARAAQEGQNRISIRLDPPELGRVDVKLEVGHDGRVLAAVAADRPETLDLLQRDSRGLERALQQAGLNSGGDGLSFSLRQQQQQTDPRFGQPGAEPVPAHDDPHGEADGPLRPVYAAARPASSRALDISI